MSHPRPSPWRPDLVGGLPWFVVFMRRYNAAMKFAIRDLLWLMALVAMAAAWWTDRRQITELRHTIGELDAMKQVVREMGVEKYVEMLLMMKDPSQEQAIKRALATINQSKPINDWTDDEIARVLDLLKPKTTGSARR